MSAPPAGARGPDSRTLILILLVGAAIVALLPVVLARTRRVQTMRRRDAVFRSRQLNEVIGGKRAKPKRPVIREACAEDNPSAIGRNGKNGVGTVRRSRPCHSRGKSD